jgi:5'-deoxynucleotidase
MLILRLLESLKKIEYIAEKQCLQSLPEEFQAMFTDIIVQDNVDEQYKEIVKAADILVAYIKALDELNHQNHEFDHVKKRLELKLDTIKQQMPEVAYFMDVFLQSCSATVDKLTEVQVKK